MPRIKLSFPNRKGEHLAGLLETPDSPTENYALFAHCFTCSKDITAASRITFSLSLRGIAVMRFDFTGLGNSDGDFANTNFSSNIQDLIDAAAWLTRHYTAPSLLIGHSLGGAAVLAAAHAIMSVKAVVTIGAPATADHIQHVFTSVKDKILEQDQARVNLAGREFSIKKQFLEDINQFNTTEHISTLNKALLVLHSPVDTIVSIDEAARIYAAAKHPKSFISLDSADHMLSNKRDSEYASGIIASWADRYINSDSQEKPETIGNPSAISKGEVHIKEQDRNFARIVYTEHHRLLADEPASYGGTDTGPNPYEFLLTALGACTSMTIRMYANKKQLPLDNIEIILSHSRIHAEDCEECESHEGYVDRIDKRIKLEGNLDTQTRQRLLEIADKCPIHKTLLNEIVIKSTLE